MEWFPIDGDSISAGERAVRKADRPLCYCSQRTSGPQTRSRSTAPGKTRELRRRRTEMEAGSNRIHARPLDERGAFRLRYQPHRSRLSSCAGPPVHFEIAGSSMVDEN